MSDDYDLSEVQPWDGKEPFMVGRCETCKQVKGICCGRGSLEYCADCCEHPWEDERDDSEPSR
jgi:hypothetical protein